MYDEWDVRDGLALLLSVLDDASFDDPDADPVEVLVLTSTARPAA